MKQNPFDPNIEILSVALVDLCADLRHVRAALVRLDEYRSTRAMALLKEIGECVQNVSGSLPPIGDAVAEASLAIDVIRGVASDSASSSGV